MANKDGKKDDSEKNITGRLSQDLSRFLTSEEGKILKKDVVKAAVVLGIIGAAIMRA